MLVDDYIQLIDAFLDGRIEVLEFESRYLAMFKTEHRPMSEETFRILDRLFADVDAFCADPTLRDEHDLDEEGLRQATSQARRALDPSASP